MVPVAWMFCVSRGLPVEVVPSAWVSVSVCLRMEVCVLMLGEFFFVVARAGRVVSLQLVVGSLVYVILVSGSI